MRFQLCTGAPLTQVARSETKTIVSRSLRAAVELETVDGVKLIWKDFINGGFLEAIAFKRDIYEFKYFRCNYSGVLYRKIAYETLIFSLRLLSVGPFICLLIFNYQ
ncbi:hypothetical protein EVAR_20192_1 [Eumeta japonica]|uniref:Uncharacterized protein n=1 Tax=Eumeta variegata TaxID=151549 RepID=A0A4C1UTP7_EUMVA|nr:hypothetical protein EVAR_20192_1 [Eumeta japonica]